MRVVILMIFFTGMKAALSNGLAALADGADVIRTVAKTVSTSTKTITAGIETLCININSIYNAMSATSKFLEDEVIDLLNLFAGVEDMSTADMIRFICKQCMYSDLDFELPLEMISHLHNISRNLKRMHIGYKKIQEGMEITSKCNKRLPKYINAVYESLEYVVPAVHFLSEAEEVSSADKEIVYDALELLSLTLNFMSRILDLVNCYKNLMYFGFKIINEGMSIVNDVIQEEVEDIKFVFQSLEYFLSQPAGMLIALNSW